MEAILTRLFDFQGFDNNSALQRVIDSVHARYATRTLDMDEMEWVSAAGTPDQLKQLKNTDNP